MDNRNLLILFLLTLSSLMTARERITPYPADSALNTGVAVVVCPGGSYSWLDLKDEGSVVCEWLQRNGISAYLLRYRVPTFSTVTGLRVLGCGWHWPAPLSDVEQSLQYIYDHAAQNGVDTTMIGVMGFSAGGHLAMASALYNRTNRRPAFLCPIYPVVSMSKECTHRRSRRGALGVWRQWNKPMQDSLSLEKHITPDCPPVFLVNCLDDPIVNYQNSVLLDSALTANHVPHLYTQYTTGGHGFGASDTKGTAECRQWKKLFLQWISNLKAQHK